MSDLASALDRLDIALHRRSEVGPKLFEATLNYRDGNDSEDEAWEHISQVTAEYNAAEAEIAAARRIVAELSNAPPITS